MTAAQFHSGLHSALKAIKRKCLDCSGGSKSEVRNCAFKDCALLPFRQGKNPNRTYSPDERARRAEHLAKLKIAGAMTENPVSIGDPRTKSPGATPPPATAGSHLVVHRLVRKSTAPAFIVALDLAATAPRARRCRRRR